MATSTAGLAVRLEVLLRADEQSWVAVCPALDVATQADSRASARAAVREAVEAWFESCLERGVLDSALREVGFSPFGRVHPVANGHEGGDFIEISIPGYAADQLQGLGVASD